MTGGGGEELPPLNGGEFLLRLVQRPQQNPPQPSSSLPPLQPHGVSLDPAVAAVGPTIPLPINGRHYPATPAPSSDTSFSPNFLFHGLPHTHPSWPRQPSQSPPPPSLFNAASLVQFNSIQEQLLHERSKVMLGSMPFNVVPQDGALSNSHPKFNFDSRGELQVNGLHSSWGFNAPVNSGFRASTDDKVYKPPEIRHQPGPPPGFAGQPARPRARIEQNLLFKGPSTSTDLRFNQRAFGGDDSKGSWKSGESERSRETELNSALASETEGPLPNARALAVDHLDHGVGHARQVNKLKMTDSWECKGQDEEISELSEHFDESLGVALVDEHDEKSDRKKHRDKEFRSDPRGQRTLSQKMRNSKRYIQCRSDIHRFDSSFLEIYESLKPAEEEKLKQKQLLSLLEKLVCKAWPNARLYLYGSCANSFGVSKSDIDVCLAIADQDINKSEVLLKLADILQSDNLENVQALTRARVPIVKLKDPVTGISCDICINNVLAVVNTKLLRDYAEIDVRLRQLAFIVKHWAKTRAVNETYQGTLSSYAYVLMCIHFLQHRRPAILPCLQGMDATYTVTVDDVKCSYFDQVERLQNFGARNKESIAQLVWGFFNYWAYCHDYSNSVISVRTGSLLSKHEKDWTRRIGNERHLICIEDPFETSHDLGRVVDKHSIRVIREEFERAAFILQFDPNPCVELFRPYVSC